MRSMIKNFVINVATNTKRQVHIQQEFDKQNIPFEFFSAITPAKNEQVAKQLNIDIKKSVSSPQELACFLSHVSLWQQCIEDNLDYIGIYEDDIFLGQQFEQLIRQTDVFQSQAIDILKLEKVSPRVHLTHPIVLPQGRRTIYELKSRHLGGAGYLLSHRACQYLLQYIRNLPQLEAVDVMLFDVGKYPKALPVYQLVPAIVIQEHHLLPQVSLTSSLNQTRSQEIKLKLTGLQKTKREILRVFRPFYMSKLTFE